MSVLLFFIINKEITDIKMIFIFRKRTFHVDDQFLHSANDFCMFNK